MRGFYGLDSQVGAGGDLGVLVRPWVMGVRAAAGVAGCEVGVV
jgi:hypothetical protein